MFGATYTYTTTSTSGSSGISPLLIIVYIAVVIFLIAAMWKVFTKAGKPGWAAIIPIYNTWVLFEIAGKPGWWALLFLIPIVNIVMLVLYWIALVEVGHRFGKSTAWGIFLLILLPIIGLPMLGFGDARYQGTPSGAAPAAATV
jgi:glycopeptide antibiotics resistance protein